jgi:DNA primase
MRLKTIHVAADDDIEEYYVVVGEITADDDNDYGFSIQVVQDDTEAEVFFRRREFRELRDAIDELLGEDKQDGGLPRGFVCFGEGEDE